MCAVIAALDARDLGPARESAGQPHREHRCLGARIAEPDRSEARDPLAEQRRQLHLDRIGGGETGAAGRLTLDRFHDLRVGVAEDHGRVVAEHVDALGPVDIP